MYHHILSKLLAPLFLEVANLKRKLSSKKDEKNHDALTGVFFVVVALRLTPLYSNVDAWVDSLMGLGD